MRFFEELENFWKRQLPKKRSSPFYKMSKKQIWRKFTSNGSRADSIVLPCSSNSRASGSKREAQSFQSADQKNFCQSLLPWPCEPAKASSTWTLLVQLDPAVGEVNLISEDFSRWSWICVTNAFEERCETSFGVGGRKWKPEAYLAKLTVKTALQKRQSDPPLSIGAQLCGRITQRKFRTNPCSLSH